MKHDTAIGAWSELVGMALLSVLLATEHIALGVAGAAVLIVVAADELRGDA